VLLWCSAAAAAAADDDSDAAGMTLEDRLAKSDPEFLQFLKDEGSSDMLGWAADDLSASSSDEADDDEDDEDDDDGSTAQQSAQQVTIPFMISFMVFCLP